MSQYTDGKLKPLDHPESAALNHVVLMAQHSLDPEHYDMFCKAHDRIVDNRHLQNDKLDYINLSLLGDVDPSG